MKIAVVGCGALGSYYGAKLAVAGHDAHFLLRSNYAAVQAQGVWVQSPDGDFRARPKCAREPTEIGPCDLVLIGLKTTANDQFPRLLPPLMGPTTLVTTLQNGLGNEEQLAAVVGAERVLGGLCFVCLNRVAPGVVCHSGYGHIELGDFQRPIPGRAEGLAALFRAAGVACRARPDLEQAHWEKLVWNIPFNGLGVAGAAGYEAAATGRLDPDLAPGRCLPTDQLLAEPRWEELVRDLMREVIAVAGALGFPIGPAFAEHQVSRTRLMGAYRASTLLDFERGQPLELEALFREPWRRAQRAGVVTPRLTALVRLLEGLDPAGAGEAGRAPRQNAG